MYSIPDPRANPTQSRQVFGLKSLLWEQTDIQSLISKGVDFNGYGSDFGIEKSRTVESNEMPEAKSRTKPPELPKMVDYRARVAKRQRQKRPRPSLAPRKSLLEDNLKHI